MEVSNLNHWTIHWVAWHDNPMESMHHPPDVTQAKPCQPAPPPRPEQIELTRGRGGGIGRARQGWRQGGGCSVVNFYGGIVYRVM